MSLPLPAARALAARLVMIDLPGLGVDADTDALLADYPVRAACLFRRNLDGEAGTQALCAALRQRFGPQALLAIDQEGGPVSRATFVPVAPSAMALGAVGSQELAREMGAVVARSLRHLGLNWNFAPVLDLNNNPANPVIAERSFGDQPDTVATLARAWLQGSHSEGVACCVKHFPGHGDTHTDSHHALPVVDKSMAELRALELRPFAALVPDAPAVMTAHIVYPQLDAELPATLSPQWLNGVLRGEMGYGGVVITDALMMDAIKQRWGHARAAVLALQAGADLVLAQGSAVEQRAALEAITTALQTGALPIEAAQRAVQRVDALVAAFPAEPRAYVPAQREADERAVREAAARSLCALRGAVAPQGPLRVIAQRAVAGTGVSEAGLSAEGVQSLWPAEADIEWLWVPDLRQLDPRDIPRDGRCNILVSTPRKRYPAPLADWPVDLHLVLWNPLLALDCAAPALLTFGYHEAVLAALRDWLAGRSAAPAQTPLMALR